ncbi:MAG: T9SS type A sorting domain-containing protein [Bacteroidota bacterium]|nr:T9SS type A sorting domain-containing protein [Bacteroidota bacterium]
MKKLLSILFVLSIFISYSQTASNFNCNDCASNNHDLFTELNSGKIVVITWVMPCSACVNGALAAQAAVQSFSASNPGMVLNYVADDYANSSCATIQSWCTTNGITAATMFANAAVSMTPYGTAGMPKVIVVGGNGHTVYYNQNNNTITQSGIQNAINTALAANVTTLKENSSSLSLIEVYPNPTNNAATLTLNLAKETKVKIEVENILGQKVMDVYAGNLNAGENSVKINTAELANGNYFVSYSDNETSKKIKLIVNR